MYKSLEASEDQYKNGVTGRSEAVRLEIVRSVKDVWWEVRLHLLDFESPGFLPGRQ